MENKNNENQLNIELTEETAKGHYSNLCVLTHSNHEFVADFVQIMPGVPKAKVNSRVIMTPQSAKRLMLALNENIARFEQQHGKIELDENFPGGGSTPPPFNFGTPPTQA